MPWIFLNRLFYDLRLIFYLVITVGFIWLGTSAARNCSIYCKLGKTKAAYYASKLWAYLIPTPANLLIYKESGYNLKVRGSNPLPATNSLIINNIFSRFYFILFDFFLSNSIFFSLKSHRTFLLVVTLLRTTQVLLVLQQCLSRQSVWTVVCRFELVDFHILQNLQAVSGFVMMTSGQS